MLQDLNLVIADRSGVDPLVYARMYCGEAAAQEMVESNTWRELKLNLDNATIIVCEPVEQWLTDDNVRLMPLDLEEWNLMHETFCTIMERQKLEYTVLSKSVFSLEERVKFVLFLRELSSCPATFEQQLTDSDTVPSQSSSETTQQSEHN